jgi:hypothetical protein
MTLVFPDPALGRAQSGPCATRRDVACAGRMRYFRGAPHTPCREREHVRAAWIPRALTSIFGTRQAGASVRHLDTPAASPDLVDPPSRGSTAACSGGFQPNWSAYSTRRSTETRSAACVPPAAARHPARLAARGCPPGRKSGVQSWAGATVRSVKPRRGAVSPEFLPRRTLRPFLHAAIALRNQDGGEIGRSERATLCSRHRQAVCAAQGASHRCHMQDGLAESVATSELRGSAR